MRNALASAGLALLAGCGTSESRMASNGPFSSGIFSMQISSPAFSNGQVIPTKYTADGQDISPGLVWSSGPTGTQQFVLIVEDPDAPGDVPAVHWLAYNIPASVNHLDESAATQGSLVQGLNYQSVNGYVGPNPPPGKAHRYFFQVFALDTRDTLPAGASKAKIEQTYGGHVLAQARMIGTYGRE
jgi:Raf kinase inhibitor-like YbhB/YbcL family protein